MIGYLKGFAVTLWKFFDRESSGAIVTTGTGASGWAKSIAHERAGAVAQRALFA